MKKYLFISLFLLFGLSYAEYEQPPFETKDPAITENFRNIYQNLDSLGVATNDSGYVCIDDPTLCVDQTNDDVLVNSVILFDLLEAWPTDKDVYAIFGRTGGSGSAPFDNAGSIILRPRLTSTDGRGSVYVYTGATPSQAMRIDEIGTIRQPLQPSFHVRDGTGGTDVTGDATEYTELWPTEVSDVGGNFTSNTFTAPVSGYYFFQANVDIRGLLVTHTLRRITLVTSNASFISDANFLLAETDKSLSIVAFTDMDINDTAYVTVTVSGSTKVVDVRAASTTNFFTGGLIN